MKSTCGLTPGLCGYPDDSSTGVPGGTSLTRVPADQTSGNGWTYGNGNVRVFGSGAVLDGLAISGDVSVEADDVTIRNSSITVGGENFGVAIRHADGLSIESSEIRPPSSGPRLMVGIKDIYGDTHGTKITTTDISGTSTAIQIGEGTIEGNYIHGLKAIDGDHLNGITSNGSTGQLTIRHNTIFNTYAQTDAIGLFQDFGVEANRLITDNLLAGGGYTLYGGSGTKGTTSGIKIINNRFATTLFAHAGYYGPVAAFDPSGPGNVWSGNVWDATGLSMGTP